MLKSNVLINVLLLLTFLLCFHSADNSIAGSCDENASSGGTSTFAGNFNIPAGFECPENLSLEYDTSNSVETIARNGTSDLVVAGDDGPYYTWTVSGQGFWFDANYTTKTLSNIGLTATLYADDTACGAATITVTGCSGPPVKGYVRCTTGYWVDKGFLCGSSGGIICSPYYSCYVTTGNKRRYYCKTCLCSNNCHVCEAYWDESEPCGFYSGVPGYCEDWNASCGPCRGSPPGTGRGGVAYVREWEWSCP